MRRFIVAAVIAVALAVPVVATAQGVDPTEARLTANVATIQHYVDNLFAYQAKHRLTARQETALAHDLDTLARNQRALAAYLANPNLPPVLAVDIGSAPIPNNAQASTSNYYGCPPDFDAANFKARYGFDLQTAFNKVVTGVLRPNLDRWQALIASSGGTFTQAEANYYKQGDVTKQKAVIAYFAGTVPFETGVAPYIGPWYQLLGCGVNIAAIHDLGAQP